MKKIKTIKIWLFFILTIWMIIWNCIVYATYEQQRDTQRLQEYKKQLRETRWQHDSQREKKDKSLKQTNWDRKSLNENKINKKKKILERKNDFNEIKAQLDNYKKEIHTQVMQWKISRQEAREKLKSYKDTIVWENKEKYKKQREQLKQENIKRIRDTIDLQFQQINTLPWEQKNIIYDKILSNIDIKMKNKNLDKKQQMLLNTIQSYIQEQKNSLQ